MSEGRLNDAAYAGRPGICRSCGALVGAGESSCLMCGASVQGDAARANETAGARRRPAVHHDDASVRFINAVVSRPVIFTFVFLIANVFLYLLMTFSGGAFGDTLVAYGAKRNALVDGGEWWRLVTPVFLHVYLPGLGPLHLLSNMYGLFMLGPYVEKIYGSAKFVVFWVVAGVAGVVASYYSVQPGLAGEGALGTFLFKATDAPSAGASGALFGLVGVLFVFGIKFRRELPDGFKRAFGTGMLPMIAINLFIGYVGRGLIDNAGHLGGLAAGMALALVFGYKRPNDAPRVAFAWHALQLAALALVVVSFMMVWRNYDGPSPSYDDTLRRITSGGAPDTETYIKAINEALPAFNRALQDGDAEAAARAAQGIESAPSLGAESDKLRGELKLLLVRAQAIAVARKEKREPPERPEKLVADFEAWQNRHLQWVKTEGPNYGISVQEPEKK